MVAITKLISYIIPIVVLILFLVFYYNPGGSFEKVKNVVSGIIGQVSVGANQNRGEKPTIPADQQQAIEALKLAIVEMKNSVNAKGGCFANVNIPSFSLGNNVPTPTFLPLGKTAVKILKEGSHMRITITGGVDGKQEVSSEILKYSSGDPVEVTPCVISGRDAQGNSIPAAFYQKIIAKEQFSGDYYLPVEEIAINADGSNKISYNKGANINFDDGGFLYTPDGKNICFFPTKNGNFACDGNNNPDGLDREAERMTL